MQSTDKLSDLGNSTLGQLIAELNNNFVQITGNNATDPGVNAMLGKLTDKVVKATELKTKAAEKEVVDSITASSDFTGKVYTKTAADTAFVKTDGSNISTQADKGKALVDVLVPALATVGTDDTKKVYTKDTANTSFVKTADLATKVAEKDVVDVLVPALATVGTDDTKKVYTKDTVDTSFVKTDGSNISTQKDKGKALVDVLVPALATVGTDDTKKVYTKDTANTSFVKTADLATKVAEKDVVDVLVPALATVGTNDNKKVYTKSAAETAFVKATELKTKAAAKDVVDAITASSDFTGKVYTKTAADTAFVKATELKTKAAAKDVVDAIFDAKDGNNKISETKIGTTFAKKTDLDNKVNVAGDNATDAGVTAMLGKLTGDNVVVKINASNLTDAANKKAFAEAILPAKDGDKSILVDKLGGFLAENTKAYDNGKKTAKELLVPSAAEIVADPSFKINVTDAKIKELVQEEMSQPKFDIPASDDVALDWTW